jgi:hypothetical protein
MKPRPGSDDKRRLAINTDWAVRQAVRQSAPVRGFDGQDGGNKVQPCPTCGAPVVDTARARKAHGLRMPGCAAGAEPAIRR